EQVVSGGGTAGSGNPMRVIVALGEPIGGRMAQAALTVQTGASAASSAPLGGSQLVTVTGTVSEANSSVTVNGIAATLTGTAFQAPGIRLREGSNLITAVATDAAGNHTTRQVTVRLCTLPPARPTLASMPELASGNSHTVSGTKTPGTAVWINGVERVPADALTTWSASVALQEGDNVLTIVTQDAMGHVSAQVTRTIVVDNLAPVITVTAPAVTNLTPLTVSGTVDDHLTTVDVNGVRAAQTGTAFQADVPLAAGANTLTIVATSPNDLHATRTLSVMRGTAPAIMSIAPAQGEKLYANDPTAISIIASDQQQDPIQYQVRLDGGVLMEWSSNASYAWQPTSGQAGPHTLEIRARDGLGGDAVAQRQIFVLRKPVVPQ
ncbi:MAG: cadherin-like beta sandwich domain-containing protein, partial [Candidatus Omnitrophica bacterium]|nr:cadherin-like beta sandwich domain-containing protein [Candidatus Omnitrophota bacterium]